MSPRPCSVQKTRFPTARQKHRGSCTLGARTFLLRGRQSGWETLRDREVVPWSYGLVENALVQTLYGYRYVHLAFNSLRTGKHSSRDKTGIQTNDPFYMFPFPPNGKAQFKDSFLWVPATAKLCFHSLQTGKHSSSSASGSRHTDRHRRSFHSLQTGKRISSHEFTLINLITFVSIPSKRESGFQVESFICNRINGIAFPFPPNGKADFKLRDRKNPSEWDYAYVSIPSKRESGFQANFSTFIIHGALG